MKFRTKLSKGAKVQIPLHIKRELGIQDGDFVVVEVAKFLDEEVKEEKDV
jgi:bifunctional DNA-binding transcriptional regulator/antitoxin component of YhaV-PrlF toxin-antitoxin module